MSKDKSVALQLSDLIQVNQYGVSYYNYDKYEAGPNLVKEYVDKYNINTNVAPECIVCQISHIEKYKDKAKDDKPWMIKCDGIPLTYDLPPKLKSQFTAQEQKQLRMLKDPVEWAEFYLAWKARPYQKVALRCSAKHIVHRWGRRCGKTEQMVIEILHRVFTTQIQIATNPVDGQPIYRGPQILVVAPFLHQIQTIFSTIQSFLSRNPELKKSEVKYTKSPFHRMEFSTGALVKGLTSGGDGATLRGQGADLIIADEADYMGEADYNSLTPILLDSPDVQMRVSSTPTGKRENYYKWCYPAGTKISLDNKIVDITKGAIGDQLVDYRGNLSTIEHTLEREYDGNMVTLRPWYGLSTTLTAEHPIYVYRAGSYSFMPAEEVASGTKNHHRKITDSDYLVVPFRPIRLEPEISHSGYSSFSDQADKLGSDMLDLLSLGMKKIDIAQKLNITRRTVFKYLRLYKTTGTFIDNRIRNTVSESKNLLAQIKLLTNWTALGLYLAEGHVGAGEVVWTFHKNEDYFRQEVIDFLNCLGLNHKVLDKSDIDNTVQIICYSSALAWLIKSCFRTKKNKRVPEFVDHGTLDQQNTFINGVYLGDGHLRKKSGLVCISLAAKQAIWDLYYLHLRLQHRVSVKENSRFASLSIQDGSPTNHIIFKSDHVLLKLRSINNFPYKGKVFNFTTSSTNTFVADFYATHNCNDSPHWKEFFTPATMLPHWKEIEYEARQNSTSQLQFMHEYMAEFAVDEAGVYQPNLVAFARTEPIYKYGGHEYSTSNIYSIGVDWNSNVGTEISIVSLDTNGHYWLVEHVNVPKQGWTQLAGVNKIVELNAKWKPRFIYVDSGHGATNAELLLKYSLEMRMKSPGDPACLIYDRLKRFDFGSRVEIRDPHTGAPIKKPAKDFMVQNSVRKFEERVIHFPLDEDLLYKQLLNYIIERVNQSGMPIYGQNNDSVGDHMLDSFNLALVAYKLELSDFALDSNYVVNVGHKDIRSDSTRTSNSAIGGAYPKDYMSYRINSGKADIGRGLVQDNKPKQYIAGSELKEVRPGFETETEHLHQNRSKMKQRRVEPSRRNI